MSKAQFIVLALLFSLSVNATEPDPRWYQADLVVFRYINNSKDEQWPPVANHTPPANAIELRKNLNSTTQSFDITEESEPEFYDIQRDAYVSLPEQERLLNEQVERLNSHPNYQVITQKAWRMPISANGDRLPVKIRAVAGQNYLLEGTVTVSEERFFHVDVDFWLNTLSPESLYSALSGQLSASEADAEALLNFERGPENLLQVNAQTPPLRVTENFHLDQRRRIKNTREIQYIDSPVIGVLFKLTPYERPKTLVETGTPASSQ